MNKFNKVYKKINEERSVNKESMKRLEKEWGRVAKDPVDVDTSGDSIYGFTTELGALRLFYKFNQHDRTSTTDIGYSKNFNSWYFRTIIGD